MLYYFPQWLYHFVFLSAINQSSCRFPFLPVLGTLVCVCVLFFVLDVNHSLVANDIEHLFLCLFATFISSLLKCLYIRSAFQIRLFIFLLILRFLYVRILCVWFSSVCSEHSIIVPT